MKQNLGIGLNGVPWTVWASLSYNTSKGTLVLRLEILEETWKLLEGTVKAGQFPKMFYKNKTFPKEETIMVK